MKEQRKILLLISKGLFRKLAPDIEVACRRLDCLYIFPESSYGDDVSLVLSIKESTSDERENPCGESVPFLEIPASQISGEASIYEAVRPFFTRNYSELSREIILHKKLRPSSGKRASTDSSAPEEERPRKSALGIVMTILFVIAVIIIFILSVSLTSAKEDLMSSRRDFDSQSTALSSVRADLRQAQETISEVKKVMPVIIKDVQIGNTDYNKKVITEYGHTIYSYNTQYLTPRISYYSLDSDMLEFGVKFFDRFGNLSTSSGKSGPYSYTMKVSVNTGENKIPLLGWGGRDSGHWPEGYYRCEIWLDGKCLFTKYFQVY